MFDSTYRFFFPIIFSLPSELCMPVTFLIILHGSNWETEDYKIINYVNDNNND